MSSIHQPPAAVYRGNALDLPLPDDSVDLVVTSPAYTEYVGAQLLERLR